MVSRINLFVEVTVPLLRYLMFVTWHSYVFANGYGLILLQALFPSQVVFEKPRKLLGHSCIVSICMGNY